MGERSFSFCCRSKTAFGAYGLDHLPFDLAAMGAQKPLVVRGAFADPGQSIKPLVRAFAGSGMPLGACCPEDAGSPPVDDRACLKDLYQAYTDKGFDAVIAFGTGRTLERAGALTLAAAMGPEALSRPSAPPRLPRETIPLAYVPTGVGSGLETGDLSRFNGKQPECGLPAPDLVVIDPGVLGPEPLETVVNAALTCLAVCAEAFVFSKNPPARAYCAAALELVMENLLPLASRTADLDNGPDLQKAFQDKENRKRHAALVHASVITGYVQANCGPLTGFSLGLAIAAECGLSPGHAMTVLMPDVFRALAPDDPDLAALLLPLAGREIFCSTPAFRKKDRSLAILQDLLNDLYRLRRGTFARTLPETGLTKSRVRELAAGTARDFSDREGARDSAFCGPRAAVDPKRIGAVLDHAFADVQG